MGSPATISANTGSTLALNTIAGSSSINVTGNIAIAGGTVQATATATGSTITFYNGIDVSGGGGDYATG